MRSNNTLGQFKNLFSPQHNGEKTLLSTLAILKKRKVNPLKLLLSSIKKLRPGVKILTQVKSGKVFYLPAYQSEHSADYSAIKWLYKGAKDRNPRAFSIYELVNEIADTLTKDSRAYKYKLDLIKGIRESKVNLKKTFKKLKYKKNKGKKKIILKFKDKYRNKRLPPQFVDKKDKKDIVDKKDKKDIYIYDKKDKKDKKYLPPRLPPRLPPMKDCDFFKRNNDLVTILNDPDAKK
jgi:ribosomal protein S7